MLPHVRLGTEVVSATWDEDRAHVVGCRSRDADGTSEVEVHALISAVGMLNRPAVPDIDGLDIVRGAVLPLVPLGPRRRPPRQAGRRDRHRRERDAVRARHRARRASTSRSSSARGTGSPPTPTTTGRSPTPSSGCSAPCRTTSPGTGCCSSGTAPTACTRRSAVDPEWPDQDVSISRQNDKLRRVMTAHAERELADRPELVDEVLPDYPALGKRMLQDNGWFRTLLRDDVDLVNERVVRVEPHAVVTESGARHDADVLVLGTGFHPNKYLWPMEITGRDGRCCTTSGATIRGRTSASPCPGSRTCSASTARTPTRWSGAWCSCSNARSTTCQGDRRHARARVVLHGVQARRARRLQRSGSTPSTSSWCGVTLGCTATTTTTPGGSPPTCRGSSSTTGG